MNEIIGFKVVNVPVSGVWHSFILKTDGTVYRLEYNEAESKYFWVKWVDGIFKDLSTTPHIAGFQVMYSEKNNLFWAYVVTTDGAAYKSDFNNEGKEVIWVKWVDGI